MQNTTPMFPVDNLLWERNSLPDNVDMLHVEIVLHIENMFLSVQHDNQPLAKYSLLNNVDIVNVENYFHMKYNLSLNLVDNQNFEKNSHFYNEDN
jgi:hypothetical protein